MKTGTYALGQLPLVMHVAMRLETGSGPLTVEELAVGLDPLGGDVFRVRENEKLGSDTEAIEWMMRYALFLLGDQVVVNSENRWLKVDPDKPLKFERKTMRPLVNGKLAFWDVTGERTQAQSIRARIEQAHLDMSDKAPTYSLRLGKARKDEMFRVHPAALAFDLMPLDKFIELGMDLKDNGLTYPLLVVGDQIIDGHHRAAICSILEIPVKVVRLDEDTDELTIRRKAFSANVQRKDLPSKAKIAQLVAEWFLEAAGEIAQANVSRTTAESNRRRAAKPNPDCVDSHELDAVEPVDPWEDDSPIPVEELDRFKGKRKEQIAIELAGASGVIGESAVRTVAQAPAEIKAKVAKGEITSVTEVKKAAQAEDPELLAKTDTVSAFKHLGNVRKSAELAVLALQAHRFGKGRPSDPANREGFKMRLNEARNFLDDVEIFLDDLDDSEFETK